MANPYYVKSLGGLSAGNAIGGAIDAYQKRKEKEELQGLMGAAAQGDKSAINQLYGINPQAAQAFENRGYAQEDRALAQNEREQLALQEQEKQRQANTVKFVERLHSLPEQQQESEMAKAVADDNFDFDEDDMLLAKSPQHRKLFLSKNLDKQAFESLFSGDTSDKMTEYQQAMIKGQDESRGLRQQEINNSAAANSLKKEELRLNIEAKKQNIAKRKIDAANRAGDAKKAKDLAVAEAENALFNIDAMLGTEEDPVDLDLIYGAQEVLYPDFLRTQKGANLLARKKQIASSMALAAAGKLKGQGSVSEGERQLLREAAAFLADETISPELAREELERIRPIFEKIKTGDASSLSDEELFK